MASRSVLVPLLPTFSRPGGRAGASDSLPGMTQRSQRCVNACGSDYAGHALATRRAPDPQRGVSRRRSASTVMSISSGPCRRPARSPSPSPRSRRPSRRLWLGLGSLPPLSPSPKSQLYVTGWPVQSISVMKFTFSGGAPKSGSASTMTKQSTSVARGRRRRLPPPRAGRRRGGDAVGVAGRRRGFAPLAARRSRRSATAAQTAKRRGNV